MKTDMNAANETDTPDQPGFSHLLSVEALARHGETRINLRPDTSALAAIASYLDLLGLRKVSLTGVLAPFGRRDWQLTARLGATITQPCVVSLQPVTTRIDEAVERVWLAKMPGRDKAGGADGSDGDTEMDENTSLEPLGRDIDIGRVLSEALALALPLYPRAVDAVLEQENFAAPGVTPMRDEDTRPFAGLADLRDKLENDPESDPDDSSDQG